VGVQLQGLRTENVEIKMMDMKGRWVGKSKIWQGSTIGYIETETLYSGLYVLQISDGKTTLFKNVVVHH
jgi:hypothetical protein